VQLVDALYRLKNAGLPARALFIGDGPERGAVEARARALGVADRFVISGFQEDVRPFLSACDVVTLTSYTEAFSLAAIEAMALGRPVVHAEVGGAAEMIAHGHNGHLFPVGDTLALVERLATLADKATRARVARNARETVEIRFTERSMIERYEQTLLELASTRSKRDDLRRRAAAH